ncbi:hypothetical protein FRB97_008992 [Tulasnella sp. 331]|nr:hypothetical protein FRB97_008992 [Tulasnella sp. 331]
MRGKGKGKGKENAQPDDYDNNMDFSTGDDGRKQYFQRARPDIKNPHKIPIRNSSVDSEAHVPPSASRGRESLGSLRGHEVNHRSDEEHHAVAGPADPFSGYLAAVLQVVPEIELQYAQSLVRANMVSNPMIVVEACVNELFNNPVYPMAVQLNDGKQKQEDRYNVGNVKVDGTDASEPTGDGEKRDAQIKKPKIDWNSLDRAQDIQDRDYFELAVDQLGLDFMYALKTYIRHSLRERRGLYYPTYFYLRREVAKPGFDQKKKMATIGKHDHKERSESCIEFYNERNAVRDCVAEGRDPYRIAPPAALPVRHPHMAAPRVHPHRAPPVPPPPEIPAATHIEPVEALGSGIECGCCFGDDDKFEDMIQCPEGHLFCRACAKHNAEEEIGKRKCMIICMDGSGCKLEFLQSELEKVLDVKALDLLDRIRAEKAVADAGFESLDECPFCDFKCIIDNDAEQLFQCQSDAYMDADRKLDARHTVEEAMTAALIRKCPKCSQGGSWVLLSLFRFPPRLILLLPPVVFMKESGAKDATKCALWDSDTNQRHHDEVAEAARMALEQQRQAQPDIDQAALEVGLPVVPPPISMVQADADLALHIQELLNQEARRRQPPQYRIARLLRIR